jgi:hypothetical protein
MIDSQHVPSTPPLARPPAAPPALPPFTISINGETLPLIDIRDPIAHPSRRSIRHAVHIPASAFMQRRVELPPRNERYAMLVDGSPACAGVVSEILGSEELGKDLGAVILETDEAFWCAVPPAAVVYGWHASARVRLWRPGPVAELIVANWREWRMPLRGPATVLDVGCGQGRNGIFLLQELGGAFAAHGLSARVPLTVIAIDKRRPIVERATLFAAYATDACVISTDAQAPDEVRAATRMTAPRAADRRAQFFVSAIADANVFIEATAARLAARRLREREASASAAAATGNETPGDASPTAAHAAAAAALAASVMAAGGPGASEVPDRFDVVLFARTCIKDAMAKAVALLLSRSRCALIAMDSFHASAPLPESADNKMDDGEFEALVRASLADAKVAAGAVGEWTIECLHESKHVSEDGRTMIQAVVRLAPAEPPHPAK